MQNCHSCLEFGKQSSRRITFLLPLIKQKMAFAKGWNLCLPLGKWRVKSWCYSFHQWNHEKARLVVFSYDCKHSDSKVPWFTKQNQSCPLRSDTFWPATHVECEVQCCSQMYHVTILAFLSGMKDQKVSSWIYAQCVACQGCQSSQKRALKFS